MALSKGFSGTLDMFSQRAALTPPEAGSCYLIQSGLRPESASASESSWDDRHAHSA